MTDLLDANIFADDRPTSCDDNLYQWAVDAEDFIRAQHKKIKQLVRLLKRFDEAYCRAGTSLTREQRGQDRLLVIEVRDEVIAMERVL